MLKKAKDWIGDNLDLYVEQDASNVISGGIKHIWNPNIGLSQEGTKIDADLINMIQKNGVLTVNGIRQPNSVKDVYLVQINGFEDFGIYEGMKLVVEFDQTNITDLVYLSLNNVEYELQNITKNDITVSKEYFIQFKNNKFELVTNKFGTTTGTSLEGKRLAEIIGLEYGGNIQDTGAKVTGKFYYDKALKYYYECIVNNNLTYNDGSKFRAISNKPISDKVENLCKVKSYSATTLDCLFLENGALVISEVGISNFKNKIGIPSNSTIVSVSVVQSYGYCEYCTYNYETDTAHVGHIVPKNNPRVAAINVVYI